MGLISRVSSRTYRKKHLISSKNMSFDQKDDKGAAAPVDESNIRITISAQNAKAVDKACAEICSRAKAINQRGQDAQIKIKGPRPMPTRRMRITTRKTPCGEGPKTWDRFQMRIHKRVIDLHSPSEIVKQITSISIEPGVEVEVTIADA